MTVISKEEFARLTGMRHPFAQPTIIFGQKPPQPSKPAGEQPPPQTIPSSPAAVALIDFLRVNDYVCPQYAQWVEFWASLTDETGFCIGGQMPLGFWQDWSSIKKHRHLREQIHLANAQGLIDKADHHLRNVIKPDEWVAGLSKTILWGDE